MKIAYITTANIPDSWAHSIQIMNMCKAFAENGADVTLLVPRRKFLDIHGEIFKYYGMKPLFKVKKIWCIDIFPGSPSKFLYWLRFISFYFSARVYAFFQHFDAVYTRDLYAPLLFPKAIIERHSFPKKMSWLARMIFRRARGLVVLTSFIKERLVKIGVASSAVLVAPDAVDEESFENMDMRSFTQYGIGESDFVCGYIGTLKTMGMEKGLAYCIGAMEYLPDNFKLIVVGGEDVDIEFYKKMSGDKKRIIFIGKVPHTDVPSYARSCNVLLAPFPQNEHYSFYMSPLKIFEYMASGRPIIASALPSIEEVLEDGVTAYLVKTDEESDKTGGSDEVVKKISKKIAETILSIKSDPERAGGIAAEALKVVKEKYTWRKRAKNIINFISK